MQHLDAGQTAGAQLTLSGHTERSAVSNALSEAGAIGSCRGDSETSLLLQRTWIWFPAPTWWLTGVCNSSSKKIGLIPCFGIQGHQACTQCIMYIHTYIHVCMYVYYTYITYIYTYIAYVYIIYMCVCIHTHIYI